MKVIPRMKYNFYSLWKLFYLCIEEIIGYDKVY